MKYSANNRGYIILVLLWLLFIPQAVRAQAVSGIIVDQEDLAPISHASIFLLHPQDSTIIERDMSDENGKFSILCSLDSAVARISCVGYETVCTILHRDVQDQSIRLSRDQLTLKEVVVKAKGSFAVKRTPTGEIYFLSDLAKKSGNPYRALSEIPSLIVNVALQSVKLLDGSPLMVLIDGRHVNSGIAPINPKEIESVEIMNVVSARYLKNGVSRIMNIRLKKKQKPYLWVQLATRHDIPLRHSMGVGYFEIGNPRYSLYGRFSGDVTSHDNTDIESCQQNKGHLKHVGGYSQDNKHHGLGELLFKWTSNEKNFFAAHVYGKWDKLKSEAGTTGSLVTDKSHHLEFKSFSKDMSYILTSSLYFQHDFSEGKILEASFAYNLNSNKNNGNSEETYIDGADAVNTLFDFHNKRSSGSFDICYSASWNAVNSFNIGSETKYLNDDIDNVSERQPVFRHRFWEEFLYASFSSKWKKFFFMLSTGMDAIWLKAGDADSHYVRPKTSVSGNYELSDNHSAGISYSQWTILPSVGQLNPYDISVDPLVVSKGNPGLKPEMKHNMRVSYTYHFKSLYLTSFSSYSISTDLIEPYGYTEQSKFISTLRNAGRCSSLSVGAQANINFPKGLGNAYLSVAKGWDYFTGQSAKPSFSISTGLWFYYKKWIWGADIDFCNYAYTPISRKKEVTPGYSQIQVNYNFTKDFYIAIGLPYFIGKLTTETETFAGSYTSYVRQSMTSMSGRPWILLRYTMRKNGKQKIKLGNVVESKEKGISLEHK